VKEKNSSPKDHGGHVEDLSLRNEVNSFDQRSSHETVERMRYNLLITGLILIIDFIQSTFPSHHKISRRNAIQRYENLFMYGLVPIYLRGGGNNSHDENQTLKIPQQSRSIMDGINTKGAGLEKIIIQRGRHDCDRKLYIRLPKYLEIVGEPPTDDESDDSNAEILLPRVHHTQASSCKDLPEGPLISIFLQYFTWRYLCDIFSLAHMTRLWRAGEWSREVRAS
jgi:hypothetical protein